MTTKTRAEVSLPFLANQLIMTRNFKISAYLLTGLILVELFVLFTSQVKGLGIFKKNSPGIVASNEIMIPKAYASVQEARAGLGELIDNIGAEPTYAEFVQAYREIDFNNQHTHMHVMGETLYEKLGLSGLAVCDKDFNFGCYHGFLLLAINTEGLDVLPRLDEACIAKWGTKELACQHGIGHGVLAYLGPKELSEALKVCSELTFKGPIGGCTSGVFMEYNFPTMTTLEGAQAQSLRPQAEESPHFPCTAVATRFVPACYYEQPQWWASVFDGNFELAGGLCQAVGDEEARVACFRGIGKSVGARVGYDVGKTIAECQTMPTKTATEFCLETAAWSFYELDQFRNLAPELCLGLSEEALSRCPQG